MAKLLIIFMLFSTLASAQSLRMRDPLGSNAAAFSTWSTEFRTRYEGMPEASRPGQSECREFSQIPGTILCLTGSVADVGRYQGRASLFAEGAGLDANGVNVGKGQLVERNSITYATYSQGIGGTDIRSEDLRNYYRSVGSHCQCPCPTGEGCATGNFCLDANEQEMYDRVIAPAEAHNPDFVVIMAPFEYGIIVEHEILHAQYFNDAAYRAAVDDFWANSLTAAEKSSISAALGESYDKNDSYLIRNEFQAYALKSEGSQFENITRTYGARFRAHLNARGVSPVLLSQ